jgi:hypothetical protein
MRCFFFAAIFLDIRKAIYLAADLLLVPFCLMQKAFGSIWEELAGYGGILPCAPGNLLSREESRAQSRSAGETGDEPIGANMLPLYGAPKYGTDTRGVTV